MKATSKVEIFGGWLAFGAWLYVGSGYNPIVVVVYLIASASFWIGYLAGSGDQTRY